MINRRHLLVIFLILLSISTLEAQTPLWEGKGRIAISSDGNEHDHDDWAATPLSLALLAAAGLQDHLEVYTYSDHIWGSNQSHSTSESGLNAYQHMRESALAGQEWFGFENTHFVCAVDNAEVAYRAMRDAINQSSAEDPLIIIAAGPMRVIGEALTSSTPLTKWIPQPFRLWAILPRGFLQVSASDRQRGSIHRPAPPARRLVCFIQHLHRHSSYAQSQYYLG